MSLLRAPVIKNNHVLARIYFAFLKKTSKAKLERFSKPNLDFSKKIRKVDIKEGKLKDFLAN